MANRKAKSKVKAKYGNNVNSLNHHVQTKELLDYLVTPLHLPQFDISNAAYNQFVIETIERLLIEAFQKILPEKVLGVQFVYAKRSKHGRRKEIEPDFTFPFLLCCKTIEEAINLSDGLAYVTKLLMNQNSSFHHRVRNHRLTYSPAVCIYSINNPPTNKGTQKGPTNVFWVRLPIDQNLNEIDFPENDIEDLNRQHGSRYFFRANLNPSIVNGLYDNEKRLDLILPFPASNVRAIRESALVNDHSRRAKLDDLQKELASDGDYLKRVSYLLKFCDVILCTPHAYNETTSYHPDNPLNPHEVITDAGLTIVIDRKKGAIKEDDWLRIQVVAQKLALFAGAAISTATEARESILNTLNKGFLHEYNNAAMDIINRLHKLHREGTPLSDSILRDTEGRLQFTKIYIKSAMTIYKMDTVVVEKMLETLITPLEKYQDLQIVSKFKLSNTIKVVALCQAALIEVLRNSYKYSESSQSDGKKNVAVITEKKGNYICFTVTNQVSNENKRRYEMADPPEGWELIQDIAKSIKGTVQAKVSNNEVSVILKIPIVQEIGGKDV